METQPLITETKNDQSNLKPYTLFYAFHSSNLIELSDCILNMLCVIDLFLILFNTSAVFLPTKNEAHCVPLLCLSTRFMIHAESLFSRKIIY